MMMSPSYITGVLPTGIQGAPFRAGAILGGKIGGDGLIRQTQLFA